MDGSREVAPVLADDELKAAVSRHYGTALKTFLKWGPVLGIWPFVVAFSGIRWLLPLGIIGGCGFLYHLSRLCSSCLWTWRCSRILRAYPSAYRSPVKKLNLRQNGRRFLTLGEGGSKPSPVMSGRDPLFGKQWPKEIAEGVWFAGDDAFGGAVLVPGSGELMCMQPRDWGALQKERASADPERISRAKRAGLKRHSM